MFMFAAEARASLHGAPVVTVTALRPLAKSAQDTPFADAMVALAQTRPNRMVTVRDHGQMHPSEWASAMGTLEARGLFRRVDVPDHGNLNFVLTDGSDE
jgi:hypothetical protein